MESNIQVENCSHPLTEAESELMNAARKESQVLQYSTTNIESTKEGPWFNTLTISLSFGVRAGASKGYRGYSVEFGPSSNERALVPGLFNGMAVLDVNVSKGETKFLQLFAIFKLFVNLIKGLANLLANAWEELDKLMNGSGSSQPGNDPMKTIAIPDTSNLDKKKDEIEVEHPSADPSHPQDIVPSKPPGIGKDGIRGTDKASCGIGIWYYTAKKDYYQIRRGEWTNHMVVTVPKNKGAFLPKEAIGLYFVWIPKEKKESGGSIWGRFYLYERKVAL